MVELVPNQSPGSRQEPVRCVVEGRAAEKSEEAEENQRLRTLYAEIAELAGGFAHEIRNPLSTMALNLDLLAEEFEHPESAREKRVYQKIERLRHESRRLQNILENFLRFARAQELRLESADLNVVIEDVRDFYEPQAMAQAIVIRNQYEHELPKMRLDVELFRQALLNLFINARQAMPEGGELLLRTWSDGSWNVLEVTDTGLGMSEEVRARVFEAFYSTRSGGSGLGLPTTRKIVEAHGGTIRVRSEPGKGSQFTLRLPNQRVKPDQSPLAHSSTERSGTRDD
ncbi:MAG: HAMP domain-containing sensor histidine kinase [Isosphaeraceae bacterium]